MRAQKIIYITVMVLHTLVFSQGLKKVPLNIAHRGGTEVFPENTMESLKDAESMGVDFLELDTWLTSDSQTVIIHDRTYGRTTNVVEIFGEDLKINQLTLAQAKALFINGGDGWKEEYNNKLKIPTIDELMAFASGKNVKLAIELKDNTNRNLQNILSSAEKYSISPDRIYITSFFRDKRYAPFTMKNVVWMNNISANVPKANFVNSGIVLDGKYFLTLVDSSLNSNEFGFDISFLPIVPNDTLKTQYLFETIDDYEWDNWQIFLRYNYPSTLTLGLKFNGIVFSSSFKIDYFQENNIKISKINDSVSIFVNGNTIKKLLLQQTLNAKKRPRLILGSDFNNDGVLYAIIKKFIWTIDNDTLASFTFQNSLKNNSKPVPRFIVSNLVWMPADVIGIFVDQYSKELTEYYKNLGYGIWVWTVNGEKLLREVLEDTNIDGIVTDAPHLLKKITSVSSISNKKYSFLLQPAYPNPFNSSTTIRFEIEQRENITLSIYDNVGRQIKQIFNREFAAGEYGVSWDGTGKNGVPVSSGVYYVVLHGTNKLKVSKIAFVK